MARVPASEATRKRLKQMFDGGQSTDRSALIRESVRLMIEEALEAEVTEALGRGVLRTRCERWRVSQRLPVREVESR
jgi:hypothetical protein